MAKIRQYLKFLLFPGIALCTAGIVVGLVAGKWSLQPLILLLIGIIFIFSWFLALGENRQNFWQKRSTVASTNALVATTAVVIILALINFLAVRYPLRLDLTENQLFTLSPQSQEIVQNLPQTLKIYVFAKQINPIDRELLENYQRYSKNFVFEFVDPDLKIGLAKEFKIKSANEVYLEYDNKKKLVQTLENGSELSEIKLTNAIEQIQRDRVDYIYFLQGHGEPELTGGNPGISVAVSSLEEKGYTVKPLTLTTNSQIPKNASTLVITGVKRALFPAEIKAIENYLDRGGKLILLLDPNINTGLEYLLKNWGIKLDNRIIIDGSGSSQLLGLGAATPVINAYENHPITKDFSNGYSVFPNVRSIEISQVKNIDAVTLIKTNNRTWAESDLDNIEINFDSQKDIPGPLNLAVALTKKNTPKTEQKFIIFGSSTFINDGWFEQQLNGDLFLNSINWLTNSDRTTLSIRPKEQKNRRLNIAPLQAIIITITALFIMPLLGLITAGIIFFYMRRK